MIKKVNFSLNQLIASDLFLGYHTSNWNPRINYFLMGKYKGSNVFNINHIYSSLRSVIYIISDMLFKKNRIWLVNENFSFFLRSKEFNKLQENFSELVFFNEKWCKGLLSNFKHVGWVKPKKFPHSVIVPNLQNNHFVVNEAFLVNIPSFSLLDSIDNPSNVFYPIPGNSKSIRSVFFLYLLVSRAVLYNRYSAAASFIFSSLEVLKKKANLFLGASFRLEFLESYQYFFENEQYLLSRNAYLVNFKRLNLAILKGLREKNKIFPAPQAFLFTLHHYFFINLLKNSLLNLFGYSSFNSFYLKALLKGVLKIGF